MHLDVVLDDKGNLIAVTVGIRVPWNRQRWHDQVWEWVEDRKVERMGPEALAVHRAAKHLEVV